MTIETLILPIKKGGGNCTFAPPPPESAFGSKVSCIQSTLWSLLRTVKPVLVATCIQRPPVLRGHSVMSQRCPRNIF